MLMLVKLPVKVSRASRNDKVTINGESERCLIGIVYLTLDNNTTISQFYYPDGEKKKHLKRPQLIINSTFDDNKLSLLILMLKSAIYYNSQCAEVA